MISFEMAKELKEAGLKWEPEIGDMFYYTQSKNRDYITGDDVDDKTDKEGTVFVPAVMESVAKGDWVFAPSLSQMLGLFRGLGYTWEMFGKYLNDGILLYDSLDRPRLEMGEMSLEEATSKALLWALKGGYGEGDYYAKKEAE